MTDALNPERDTCFDLSVRTKLRVTGADRLRFLNGQITNDLRKSSAGSTIQACVLNAKGKTNANIFVTWNADSFLVDADPALREALLLRLERYIIADDVQLEDVSEQFSLFHLTGEALPVLSGSFETARAERFGVAGWDIWSARPAHERVWQQLTTALAVCDEQCAEIFRIEKGIPRWGAELTEEIIPVEANLERTCVDYAKGCYIGQEVISRMKMSGQANKRLCGFVSVSEAPLRSGMRLVTTESGGKDVGWLTSATRSATLGTEIALGYAKRGFNSVGRQLLAVSPGEMGVPGVPVEVAALPFL